MTQPATTPREIAIQWYRRIELRDLDGVMDLLASDYINHSAAEGAPHDRDGIQVSFGMFFFAFADIEVDVQQLVVEGDTVAAHIQYRGTHEGEFMGHPGSGRDIEMASTEVFRVADGHIVERWGTADMLGLMVQLGILAEPEMG